MDVVLSMECVSVHGDVVLQCGSVDIVRSTEGERGGGVVEEESEGS